MEHYLILAAILLFSFFIRYGLRARYKNAISSDTYFHLSTAKLIRANKGVTPKIVENYVLPHRHLYPHLYHLILAAFNERSRVVFERMSAPLFDTANVAITYLFFRIYLEGPTLQLNGDGFWVLIYTAAVAISPGLLRMYGGPRAYNGSPRILGQFLFITHVYSFLLFLQYDQWWMLIVSAVCVGLLSFTAKFGVQVVVFFTPAFIVVDWYYGFVIVGGLVLAIILTRGMATQILRANFVHSYNYFFKQKATLYPKHRTLKHYFHAVKWNAACLLKEGKINQFVSWIFSENHSFHLLIVMFPYYIIIIMSLFSGQSGGSDGIVGGLYALTISSIVVFFLTKNKPFLFVGEAERYLEYALFALVPFGLMICQSLGMEWLVFVYLGYSALLVFFFIPKVIKFLTSMEKNYEEIKGYEEILKQSEEKRTRVFPNPFYLAKDLVYHTDCEVVSYYPATVDEKLLPRDEINFVYHNGGQEISKQIFEVFDKYEIEYLFTEKAAVTSFLADVFEQPEAVFYERMELIKETDRIQLYKYKKS